MGCVNGPRSNYPWHAFGRLAHCPYDGFQDYETQTRRRFLRRNGWRNCSVWSNVGRYSSFNNTYDYRRDCRCRLNTPVVGREMGSGTKDCLGLGFNYSRRGNNRRSGIFRFLRCASHRSIKGELSARQFFATGFNRLFTQTSKLFNRSRISSRTRRKPVILTCLSSSAVAGSSMLQWIRSAFRFRSKAIRAFELTYFREVPTRAPLCYLFLLPIFARVAQWIRAFASGAKGRRFDPCRGYQLTFWPMPA